ncbi:Major surface-labeled trophozoite antigen precursor [Giardia duodenalis]|uniref:Major surface-labeled trophozoite antigen n=1 Tax=Giardia intestinalis TaxID=5741 RepID=V6TUF3_GIAIN|nr:Major surface-labeled trophozoite antigen precursor [Giardia intestinalis]
MHLLTVTLPSRLAEELLPERPRLTAALVPGSAPVSSPSFELCFVSVCSSPRRTSALQSPVGRRVLARSVDQTLSTEGLPARTSGHRAPILVLSADRAVDRSEAVHQGYSLVRGSSAHGYPITASPGPSTGVTRISRVSFSMLGCRAKQDSSEQSSQQHRQAFPRAARPREEVVAYRTREVPGKASPRENRGHLPEIAPNLM